jgi:hypothetical protein
MYVNCLHPAVTSFASGWRDSCVLCVLTSSLSLPPSKCKPLNKSINFPHPIWLTFPCSAKLIIHNLSELKDEYFDIDIVQDFQMTSHTWLFNTCLCLCFH